MTNIPMVLCSNFQKQDSMVCIFEFHGVSRVVFFSISRVGFFIVFEGSRRKLDEPLYYEVRLFEYKIQDSKSKQD